MAAIRQAILSLLGSPHTLAAAIMRVVLDSLSDSTSVEPPGCHRLGCERLNPFKRT